MREQIKQIVRSSTSSEMVLPKDFEDLRIRDVIPNKSDWDTSNRNLCLELDREGYSVVENETDVFWLENARFIELIEFIEGQSSKKSHRSIKAGPHGSGSPPPIAGAGI